MTGLVVARALIGAGVAVCLMAPLKALATWYPRERQASLGAWIMTAGGVGALVAATPTEIALRYVHWRTLFVGLAAVTFAVALWIWLAVPDTPGSVERQGVKAQWTGRAQSVRAIRDSGGSRRSAASAMGAFFAVQGLWSVPWLIEVNGYDRAAAARHLLLIGIAMLVGFLGLGAVRDGTRPARPASRAICSGSVSDSTRLRSRRYSGSFRAPMSGGRSTVSGASTNILAFIVLNDGFATELAGPCQHGAQPADVRRRASARSGGSASSSMRPVPDSALDIAGGLRLAFALVLLLERLGVRVVRLGLAAAGGEARLHPPGT